MAAHLCTHTEPIPGWAPGRPRRDRRLVPRPGSATHSHPPGRARAAHNPLQEGEGVGTAPARISHTAHSPWPQAKSRRLLDSL